MSETETGTEVVEVLCKNNGSLRISGKFIVKDANGNVFDLSGRQAVGFCRCGHSKTKPFCDGAHKTEGFESVVQAFKLPNYPQKG